MLFERIIPEALRERFPRMRTEHPVGRCCGEVPLFPGLPGGARCTAVVVADDGYVTEVDNTSFGTGKQRLYFCVACVNRARGA